MGRGAVPVSLSGRFEQGPPQIVHGNPCSVAVALSALPEDEREALIRMLDDRRWTEAMIYDALQAEEIQVGRQSIGRHRRRGCRCFR